MTKCTLSPLLVAVLIMLQGCSGNTGGAEKSAKGPLSLSQQAEALTSKKACEAEGGNWQKVGRAQLAACVLPASDAGKQCSDSRDCEVACITLKEGLKPGTSMAGQCHESTNLFGCRTHITEGVAEPTLCID